MVIGGHTHDATDRTVTEPGGRAIRAVNPGSVGNSHRPDRCATYALLHADGATPRSEPRIGPRIEHRVVDYDHGAELAMLARVRHPAADHIAQFHQGPLAPRR
jgi:diadenosine tetraphosphatase ApaH/serine/threonine PP2A family protein phosphatase